MFRTFLIWIILIPVHPPCSARTGNWHSIQNPILQLSFVRTSNFSFLTSPYFIHIPNIVLQRHPLKTILCFLSCIVFSPTLFGQVDSIFSITARQPLMELYFTDEDYRPQGHYVELSQFYEKVALSYKYGDAMLLSATGDTVIIPWATALQGSLETSWLRCFSYEANEIETPVESPPLKFYPGDTLRWYRDVSLVFPLYDENGLRLETLDTTNMAFTGTVTFRTELFDVSTGTVISVLDSCGFTPTTGYWRVMEQFYDHLSQNPFTINTRVFPSLDTSHVYKIKITPSYHYTEQDPFFDREMNLRFSWLSRKYQLFSAVDNNFITDFISYLQDSLLQKRNDGQVENKPSGWMLFPSRIKSAGDVLTIHSPSDKSGTWDVTIYSILGTRVFSSTLELQSGKVGTTLSMPALEPGAYFLHIKNSFEFHVLSFGVSHK